jgi:hypothetical protein
MEQIKHAIGKNDLAARAAVLFQDIVQSIAGEDFGAGVHAIPRIP